MWKDQFDQDSLENAKILYENGSVTKLSGKDGRYTAFVMDESRGYSVYCSIRDGHIARMSCTCAQSAQGFACAHKAAILFATEKEIAELVTDEVAAIDEEIYENYSYFARNKIRKSLGGIEANHKKASILMRDKATVISELKNVYEDGRDAILTDVQGTCKDGDFIYRVGLRVSRNQVEAASCNCMKSGFSRGGILWERAGIKVCEHKIALLEEFLAYCKDNVIADATNAGGNEFLEAFLSNRAKDLHTEVIGRNAELQLIPKLVLEQGELKVSFKIGHDKLYVVKNLTELCENVKKETAVSYGKGSGSYIHSADNFSKRSQKLLSLIMRSVAEENAVLQHLNDNPYYMRKPQREVRSEIKLFGWRIDAFYDYLQEQGVEFEEIKGGKKTKKTLHGKDKNPFMELIIEPTRLDDSKEFHGVTVSGELPLFFQGIQNGYYFDDQYLCRTDVEYLNNMEPLFVAAKEQKVEFIIGRKHLSEFYYMALPELCKVARIKERYPEEIKKYVPPEAVFDFYLDSEEVGITCKAVVSYGEETFFLTDSIDLAENEFSAYRNVQREKEVLSYLLQLLPNINTEKGLFYGSKREDVIFEFVSKGVDLLCSLGNVQSTDRFRNMNLSKKLKVSIGVSVSNGLLDLDISSEDVSKEELLEVLLSYQQKKRYHRLKNGDFVVLEKTTYGMLEDIFNSLQISIQEFVEGNMKVPAYRAIYLDKMLESTENVYVDRDSHFRNLIKEFKAVEDGNFAIPESLSHVLRGYQKKGYRWLRSLASNHFGGILADDMGLGKTLQMITVLLATKEENIRGTSLVISPASLVYNWSEEIKRYAPVLKVGIVSGTMEERAEIIERYEEYDCLVTSYDLCKRDIASYEGKHFLYEIIDEAQYIKNHTTETSKAVKIIDCEQRFALTGTPIENRLSELWSIFDYLMPRFLFSYDVFKNHIEIPIVKLEDEAMAERLRKMVSPFILRRLKENVLKDLPEKLEEVYYAKMDSEQWKLYDAQVVEMRQMLTQQTEKEFLGNKIKVLSQLTKLRQMCCDPSLCLEDYNGGSAKREVCIDLVKRAIEGGHKILLFSQFTSMMALLESDLKANDISYYVITGSTPKEKRLQLVNEFNEDDTSVFLISLKAGGTGLNLTGADVVIHYDPWWNQAVMNQATDRAHRIGQKKKVTVYQLIAKNSIEEKIVQIQKSKKDLADQIVSGEVGQLSGLTKEEFLELLQI